jgi:FtsZ-binding cell division protein ZapB
MKKKSGIISCGPIKGTLLIVFIVCFFPSGAISADEEAQKPDIVGTRAALEKWVETQRIISQEKRNLELAKEMLVSRIELVQREIESLRGKITEANTSIAEADKKREDMIKENEKFKDASASLGDIIVSLENRTRKLLRRLPDPIRERIKPLSQRLPENATQTKLSTAERFQNIVGILNEIDKFNREISVMSEVRTLADGSSVEVTALYIGIGQGYYASANEKVAGIGRASDEGWVWKPAEEAAPKIAEAIAILKNEKVASFVQLPVEIK